MGNTFILHTKIGELDLSEPRVMGILNITPDSFYDGNGIRDTSHYLNQAETMLNEGADIIDVGAVSTRPGATMIDIEEERKRIFPVLEVLKSHFPETIISVDTFRSKIAEESVERGAHIINDISGGQRDQEMIPTIARLKVAFILMHMQGTPENMQDDPQYEDVVEEVELFFKLQLNKLMELGVTSNVVLDPGFGFGKTATHNYELLKGVVKLKKIGFPLLAGVSRKSMINRVLGTKPEAALNGTSVVNTLALLNGVNILRVHDVKEARQAIQLVKFYNSI